MKVWAAILPIRLFSVGLNKIHTPADNQQYTTPAAQHGNMSIYRRSGNVGDDRGLVSYNMGKVGSGLRNS